MTDHKSRSRSACVLMLLSFGLFVASACGSQDGGADPSAALPTEGRWDCARDGDCINSCKLGAVSESWYRSNEGSFIECSDGCNNQISGPPRCIDGQCVAFDRQGARRDHCTRKRN